MTTATDLGLLWDTIGLSWRVEAACLGMDPREFDNDDPTPAARQACERCGVGDECLEYAITYGIFGYLAGTTERQRRKIAVKLRVRDSVPANPMSCPSCGSTAVTSSGGRLECIACRTNW